MDTDELSFFNLKTNKDDYMQTWIKIFPFVGLAQKKIAFPLPFYDHFDNFFKIYFGPASKTKLKNCDSKNEITWNQTFITLIFFL